MGKIRLDQLNDQLYEEWAAQYGLKPHPQFFGNASSLRELLDKPDGKRIAEESLLDHARYFVLPPAQTKVSVIVSAPYEKAVLASFGSPGEVAETVHAVAARYGLRARVAHPSDLTYVSAHFEDPTLPIVWWNPSRFKMPYPKLLDPRPRFVERLI